MVNALLTHGADLVKLSSFMHLEGNALYHCDPDVASRSRGVLLSLGDALGSGAHGLRWGFGFSFVHKSKAAVIELTPRQVSLSCT